MMDIVYQSGSASALEVRQRMSSPPSYSGVRRLLKILEEKGHLQHRMDGTRHTFFPTTPRERVRGSAIKQLVGTFFEGSVSQTVVALLEDGAASLTERELDELAAMIETAKREGR